LQVLGCDFLPVALSFPPHRGFLLSLLRSLHLTLADFFISVHAVPRLLSRPYVFVGFGIQPGSWDLVEIRTVPSSLGFPFFRRFPGKLGSLNSMPWSPWLFELFFSRRPSSFRVRFPATSCFPTLVPVRDPPLIFGLLDLAKRILRLFPD